MFQCEIRVFWSEISVTVCVTRVRSVFKELGWGLRVGCEGDKDEFRVLLRVLLCMLLFVLHHFHTSDFVRAF